MVLFDQVGPYDDVVKINMTDLATANVVVFMQ
jgi:hypothetical protein